MEWTNVATFNESGPAKNLVAWFERSGIPARLHDERALQKWFTTEPLATQRVQIDKPRFNDARRLLTENDEGQRLVAEAVHCPDCGSPEIEYPQFTRKFVLPSIGVFLSNLGFMEKQFFCRQCHYTWPVKQKVEPAKDVLGWPKGSAAKPAPKAP